MRYSAFALVRKALRGNRHWAPVWREPEPKPAYDVVIIGGGGHGLATAYYLAKEHGITNVAVLEKGYLGSGNVGRNTTIIRSNYLLPGNMPFYEWSHEALGGARAGPQLQRHGQPARRAQPLPLRRAARRLSRGAATPCGCTASMPSCSTATQVRGDGAVPRLRQRPLPDPRRAAAARAAARCGTTRWPGAMRARADARGVDIIQNCEVTGFRIEQRPRHRRRDDARADRRREGRPGGRRQLLARRRAWPACGCRSRATSCRPSSPRASSRVIDTRRDLRRRPFLRQPVRQGRARLRRRHRRLQLLCPARQPAGDRGRVRRRHGADARRSAALRMLRHWGGAHGHDRWTARRSSTARRSTGLYLNCGWCYGGFKATPASGWCFAHLIAKDEPHPVAAAFRLDRFAHGARDRREGHGRPAESALRPAMRDHLSLLRRARRRGVHLSRRRRRSRGPTPRRADAEALASITSICATTRPARIASSGITRAAAAPGSCVTRDTRTHEIARRRARRAMRAARRRREAHEPHRLAAGGLIDRTRAARASPSTASAMTGHRRRHARLGAARQRRARSSAARSSITARAASSRPAPEEPNALVELGDGARREPNTRATTVELYDGLDAREPEPLAVAALRPAGGQRLLVAALRRRLLLQDLHVAGGVLGEASTSR